MIVMEVITTMIVIAVMEVMVLMAVMAAGSDDMSYLSESMGYLCHGVFNRFFLNSLTPVVGSGSWSQACRVDWGFQYF